MKLKLFIYLSLIICVNLKGQNNLKFKHITNRDGLSQNIVISLFQDSNGFLWFGTKDGLNKYDGLSFVIYRNIHGDFTSISNNEILSISEDSKGYLWVGTRDGLNRYNPKNDKFKQFFNDPIDENSISGNYITVFFEDSKGNFWIGSNNGLNRFDNEKESFIVYQNEADNSFSISGNEVTAIFEDSKNNLWIGTTEGLSIFDYEKDNFKRIETVFSTTGGLGLYNGISHNHVTSITEDKDGMVWFGTNGGGLNQYHRDQNKFSFYRHNPGINSSISSNRISCLHVDRRGAFWIGTDKGINLYNQLQDRFYRYTPDQNNNKSLSSMLITAMIEDNKGDMWFTTYYGGVNYYSHHYNAFEHYKANESDETGLNSNIINSILEDESLNLWIATDRGGLNYFDRNSETVRHYLIDNESIENNYHRIKCMALDQGNLWIGTSSAGLLKFNLNNESIVNYKNEPGISNSLAYNDVSAIMMDNEGKVWIGTNGEGISVFDEINGSFTHIKYDDSESGLNGNIVNTIVQNSEGKICIGTDNGLNIFDLETGAFTSYLNLEKDQGLISRVEIYCIHEDESGNLWLGSAEDGLFYLNNRTGEYVNYRIEHGLSNNVVYGILEDDNNILWVSTNNGISQFNPETKKFKKYTVNDGLQDNQFTANAFLKSRTGEVFFGGINGLSSFDPLKLESNEYIPPVYITNFKILNKSKSSDHKKTHLRNHICYTDTIELSYKQSTFELSFVALDYTVPEKNQYKYILEGFDDDWIDITNQPTVSYTKVPPGEYVFRAIASNNDGLWNETGKSVTIYISPPIWKTAWFYIVIIAIIIVIIIAYIRFRERVLKEEKRVLEEKIQESIKQVEDKKQEIEEQNKALLLKQKEDEHRNWASEGMTKFSDLLREDNKDLDKFTYTIISGLAKFLGAQIGGFFIKNDEEQDNIFYELRGAYAYEKKRLINKSIKTGEGLVGACAFDRKTIYYTDIPKEYVKISSGLGEVPPTSLLITPCIFNEEVFGIIELASLDKFDEYKISFVEELCEKIASTISVVKNNERTERLLENSKEQANALITSEEELRQNLEEMRATQEQSNKREKELLKEMDIQKEEISELRRKLRLLNEKSG